MSFQINDKMCSLVLIIPMMSFLRCIYLLVHHLEHLHTGIVYLEEIMISTKEQKTSSVQFFLGFTIVACVYRKISDR